MQLVDKHGNPAAIGQTFTTFRGEDCLLLGGTPPRHPSSTGRVHVQFDDGTQYEYFPSVINLRWQVNP